MEAEGGIQTGKKGGALRVSQLSDPLPVCPVPPTPTSAVSGWEGWLSLGQVWCFFFQWEPRTVLAAAITLSLGNFNNIQLLCK